MYTNQNSKITIVDDDPAMTEMLKDFFERKFPGAVVTTFASGETALSGIYFEPDIIILDYHLDSMNAVAMNGLQVLKKLKEQFPAVPVIFLSSQEKTEIAANTMKYGAYDYIVKNENAFHRLEIILNNIRGHADLKKNLGTQKIFNTILAILVLALIAGFFISKMLN
ncbi:MAG: response regulator [Bacteroidetes bacterium]|nr:response regulator [Bacteroidota bacterium]